MVSPDAVPCTEQPHRGGHHYGPDEGNGVRRMWLDEAPAAPADPLDGVPRCERCGLFPINHRGGTCIYPGGETEKEVSGLSADMADVFERLDAIEGQRRDMALLIRILADVHEQLHPGGLVAQRGDKPGPGGDTREASGEMSAVAVAVAMGVADYPEDDKAAAGIIDGHAAAGAGE